MARLHGMVQHLFLFWLFSGTGYAVSKPNRAHYRLDTYIGHKGWTPTENVLCVFHARRIISDGYRLVALASGGRAMSRPVDQDCSECLVDDLRCEHDAQSKECPEIPGDTCGRDSDKELGGSW